MIIRYEIRYLSQRRITNEKTREKLTQIGEELKPEGQGIIIRTAAENASRNEIKKEISSYPFCAMISVIIVAPEAANTVATNNTYRL